jgi:hypothetical protein
MTGHRTGSMSVALRASRPLLAAAALAIGAVASTGAAAAQAAPGRTFEAERAHAPRRTAEAYKDRTASGGRAVVLGRKGSISFKPARFGARRVSVWARTRECHGGARVVITIDGKRVLNVPVQDGGWKEYGSLVRVRTRVHRVKVSFPNPSSGRGCKRLLRVDRVIFSKTATSRWQSVGGAASDLRGWRTVKEDNFEGPGLDQHLWTPGNWKPSKFYDPSNVLVQNGLLRLQASAPNRSAMVQTLGKFQMTYGRVEAAIRMPRGQGFWPAFWLQTTDVAHGDPEIDILEMWMTDATDDLYDEHTISQNYHYQYRGQKADVHSWVRSPVDYTKGFHHFAMEWEPGVVRWYIDDVKTKEYRNTGVVGRGPMYLILSLQIGHADWIPGFGATPATPFPSSMDVDWLKVWKR